MADKEKTSTQSEAAAEPENSYVSDQLAFKIWSVIARYLHEGDGIVLLRKAWDSQHDSFIIFPSYAGQDPDAMKPDVWMSWRHELKAPLGGHTYIRDYAEVVDAVGIQSPGALAAIGSEHALMLPEARRRYDEGEPGLVALVLRVFHLPRAYRFNDVAEKEGEGEAVPLPFDVVLEDLVPAIDDADFERRYARVKAALGR